MSEVIISLVSADLDSSISLKNRDGIIVTIGIEDLFANNDRGKSAMMVNKLKSFIEDQAIPEDIKYILRSKLFRNRSIGGKEEQLEEIYEKLLDESQGIISGIKQLTFILLIIDDDSIGTGDLDDWEFDNNRSLNQLFYTTRAGYVDDDMKLLDEYLRLNKSLKFKGKLPFKIDDFILAKKPLQIVDHKILLAGIKEEIEDDDFIKLIDRLFDVWSDPITKKLVQKLTPKDVKFLGLSVDMLFCDKKWRIKDEKPPKRIRKWIDSSEKYNFLKEIGYRTEEDPIVVLRKAIKGKTTELNSDIINLLESNNYQHKHFENVLKWLFEKNLYPVDSESKIELIELTCRLAKESDNIKKELTEEIANHSKEWDNSQYSKWKTSTRSNWRIFSYPGKIISKSILNDNLIEEEMLLYQIINDCFIDNENDKLYLNSKEGEKSSLLKGLRSLDEFPLNAKDLGVLLSDSDENSKQANDREERKESDLDGKINRLRSDILEASENGEKHLKWLINQLEWEYFTNIQKAKKQNAILFKRAEIRGDKLLLSLPNIDELPSDLVYLGEQHTDIKLYLGKNGRNYKNVNKFRIESVQELNLTISVDKLEIDIGVDITAKITLPIDHFLLKSLLSGWKELLEDQELDQEISEVLNKGLQSSQLGFIFGPPGTGKTTELAKLLSKKFNSNSDSIDVLVLTPTNNAADVLYKKVMEFVEENNHQILRFGRGSKVLPNTDGKSRLVITTVHRYAFDLFEDRESIREHDWDYLCFDEASMIPLPYMLFPIFDQINNLTICDKNGEDLYPITIAGDPFQLMPVGLTPSLGDRIEKPIIRGFTTDNIYTLFNIHSFDIDEVEVGSNTYSIRRLKTNYRSDPSIVSLFDHFKYLDALGLPSLKANRNDIPTHKLNSENLAPINIWTFSCQLPKKDSPNDITSIFHYRYSGYQIYSAVLAAKSAIQLLNENKNASISVLTPYSVQTKICEAILHETNINLNAKGEKTIHVSTVHRFQGDESDIIIFVLNPASTMHRGRFKQGGLICGETAHFNNHNLLNVAISRPKNCLICIIPERESIDTRGYSKYSFFEEVLVNLNDSKHAFKSSAEIESGLPGRSISGMTHLEQIRNFDVYRSQSETEDSPDLIFLSSDKMLTQIIQNDLVNFLE